MLLYYANHHISFGITDLRLVRLIQVMVRVTKSKTIRNPRAESLQLCSTDIPQTCSGYSIFCQHSNYISDAYKLACLLHRTINFLLPSSRVLFI
jgi:hypothetical protein